MQHPVRNYVHQPRVEMGVCVFSFFRLLCLWRLDRRIASLDLNLGEITRVAYRRRSRLLSESQRMP